MPITTNVVSSNKAYSIQHYVIKFVSNLWQVDGFSEYSVFSTNKTDHNITVILLKVALNTIKPTKDQSWQG
jgi:hypothetical protein